jgi:hypothetical protein
MFSENYLLVFRSTKSSTACSAGKGKKKSFQNEEIGMDWQIESLAEKNPHLTRARR